jgi:hypothetical protein
MLCENLLGIVVLYVHDWETIINMYNTSKSWRKQICNYTDGNITLTSGIHKDKSIFELIVTYPSYLEYLAKQFYSPYLTKILKTVQCRCNEKFIRMTYGKYKGELINNIPREYMQWLMEKDTTDVYVKRTMINLLRRQHHYIPVNTPYHPRKKRKFNNYR